MPEQIPIGVVLASLAAAAAPVVLWFFVIRPLSRPGFFLRFWLVFSLAALFSVVFFGYEHDLRGFLANRGFPLFVALFLVGAMVEYGKNLIVRFGGRGFFCTVEDVVNVSLASALGFTFFENFLHFMVVLSGADPNISDPIKILKFFLIREFFVLPVHLFCSGLFGFFYGMALFSGPKLQKQAQQSFLFRTLELLLAWLPGSSFAAARIAQGSLISIGLYAIFFMLFELDPRLSHITAFFSLPTLPFDERLMPLFSFGLFGFGAVVLFALLDEKRRLANRGLLIERQTP